MPQMAPPSSSPNANQSGFRYGVSKPRRGLTSCVAGVESGGSVNHDSWIANISRSSHPTKRGRLSGVQSSDGCANSFLTPTGEHQPLWTEEPSPMVGADGGATIRGQQATVEARTPVSPVHNQAQAFALGQPTPALVTAKTSEPKNVIQSGAQHEIEVEEDSVRHRISYNEASATIPESKDEPHTYQAQGYPEAPSIPTHHKLPPYRSPLRVGTCPAPLFPGHATRNRITRPHPLRISSTHVRNDAVRRGASGSSLLASLFASSYKHSTLFMLAVAVAYDDLEDPQHDFELMQAWLKDHKSGNVRFRGLSGEEATREKIENAICELYREALQVPGSNLLILLTGEGHYTNKMHLLKGRFITDSDLRIWLWKLRNESKPTEVPTTIILDYCRPNKHIPLGNEQEGVNFIWSCSLGQTAAALRLPSTQDIPRSCFLLALMMFSYNCAYIETNLNLSSAINCELGRLSSFLSFVHDQAHSKGLCNPCRNKMECRMPAPRPQNPDWQQAGCMKPIYDLTRMLSTMGLDVVPKVYRVLMSNRWFREANELPVNWVTTTKGDSLESSGVTRYKRGTCQPARMYIRSLSRGSGGTMNKRLRDE